ncbi:MAG: signal recognition particle protein [Chlamydiales bacterium]|nr:signal recognition particle protein [Chlamydiales bacterium]
MFGKLTEKFSDLCASLRGKKHLSEDNIADAVRQVRLALLDGDVSYKVVSRFVARVKEKALGANVLKSVDPGEQFIKLVHDELVELMGKDEASLRLNGKPSVIMVCGLQGSGKTTTCAKLANYLKKQGKSVAIAALDLQRPAAIDQLETLGKQVGVNVIAMRDSDPVTVAKQAMKTDCDVLICDTAGRLHIDEKLMAELKAVKEVLKPHEVLFVASAAIGQDAVKTASEFDEQIGMTGSILTMLDGNARAGAAISILDVTGKPLKFEGVGEKIDDLQLFNPQSMADRILGFGDVINLVKKAEAHIDEKQAKELEAKMKKASFTYEDYLSQMKMMRKMGSLKGLLSMMPGASKLGDLDLPEKEMQRVGAIIESMTPKERTGIDELLPPRRLRIAKGSGTNIDQVNKLVKSHKQMKSLMKKTKGMKNLMKMVK